MYRFHMISIYFWHTIMILHRCIDHDLKRTSLGLGSIGKKLRSNLNFKLFTIRFPFLLDNSIFFWHTMMILHTCIKRDPRRTSVDFEVKSLLFTLYRFHTVTPFLFDILWWYVKRSKVKGIYVYISCLNYWLFPYRYSITFFFLWAKEDL